MPLPDLTVPTLTDHRLARRRDRRLGHDPRSTYVERFWLGILGPSTTWLLRRLAAGLDRHPDGFELPLAETARPSGSATRAGATRPFMRSLARCCQFGAATFSGSTGLAVRRRLPPLTRARSSACPPSCRTPTTTGWRPSCATPAAAMLRRRARRLALSLVELGEDVEATERQLHRWRFHPALAREAAPGRATASAGRLGHLPTPPHQPRRRRRRLTPSGGLRPRTSHAGCGPHCGACAVGEELEEEADAEAGAALGQPRRRPRWPTPGRRCRGGPTGCRRPRTRSRKSAAMSAPP